MLRLTCLPSYFPLDLILSNTLFTTHEELHFVTPLSVPFCLIGGYGFALARILNSNLFDCVTDEQIYICLLLFIIYSDTEIYFKKRPIIRVKLKEAKHIHHDRPHY